METNNEFQPINQGLRVSFSDIVISEPDNERDSLGERNITVSDTNRKNKREEYYCVCIVILLIILFFIVILSFCTRNLPEGQRIDIFGIQ